MDEIIKNLETLNALFKGRRARVTHALMDLDTATYQTISDKAGISQQHARNILTELSFLGAVKQIDLYPMTFQPNREFINKALSAVKSVR